MMAERARGLQTITKRRQLHDRQARARPLLATPRRDRSVINPRGLLAQDEYVWFSFVGAVAATVRCLPGRRCRPGWRKAGQIEPGDADGDREGGPASQMETR
jgi:hypothetical protein